MSKTFIIAEAGVNHNGSIDLAYQLIDAATESGADAIKFQTFKAENLVTRSAKQATYQTKNIGEETSQYDMLKNLELPYEDFRKLKTYCEEKGITFLSTPFDMESVDFLLGELKLTKIKVPSGEITNAPYLYKIALYGVDIILSTGMATKNDIHVALAFLAYGYSGKEEITLEKVNEFYKTNQAKLLLEDKVVILHCTSEYPVPFHDVNLNAMDDIKETFQLDIGFSDHTVGIVAPIAAVAKGAKAVEKHFTLDKTLPGPDHKASLEPNELKDMIDSIRIVEQVLGKKEKAPVESELKNMQVARKSLVTSKPIKIGDIFSEENLTIKRPGTGVDPKYYWDYIGSRSTMNYGEDEVVKK